MANDSKSDFSDIPQLVRDYATQELVDPLKSLGRYLGFGLSGALAIGMGLLMLGFAGLRAMQVEAADTFDGNWSVVPYIIVSVVGIIVLAIIGSRIKKGLDE